MDHSTSPRPKNNNAILWRMITYCAIGLALFGGVKFKLFQSEKEKGESLVAEMVKASGGETAWNALKTGQFLRTHQVYNELGEVIKTKHETIFFQKNKEGVSFLFRYEIPKGTTIWIGKDDEGYWATKDGEYVDPVETARDIGAMCAFSGCSPLCVTELAFFRMSMPFKLQDEGVWAKHKGTTELNGRKVEVLDVTYNPLVGRDRWVFFVDPQSKLIRKIDHYTSIISNTPPEEVYWSDFSREGGIQFSHAHTYYRSNGKVLEDYKISGVKLNQPLPAIFFDRP